MTFCGGTGVIVTSLDLIASILRQDGAMVLFRRNIEVIDTLCAPEFFSWNFGLEMSISSETASALMFCHGEKLERNVVVCVQMASLQLL